MSGAKIVSITEEILVVQEQGWRILLQKIGSVLMGKGEQMMPDREKYIEILSKAAKTVKEFNEDTPIIISLECVEDILELLKEQESWINEIAEYKQSISGSGMHELDDYEKGKLDGLQIAWNIISEGR